jgi:hypothetical protein
LYAVDEHASGLLLTLVLLLLLLLLLLLTGPGSF